MLPGFLSRPDLGKVRKSGVKTDRVVGGGERKAIVLADERLSVAVPFRSAML